MRCLIDASQWAADDIELAPDESHHLVRVLRARPGEQVGLFTGQGHTAEATFIAVRQKRALVRVLPATRRETPPPAVAVTLIQAIPKHALMDGIIQKAVELGVQAIQPLMTERVIVRLSSSAAEQRRGRWQKIALEATRQCGVAWMPSVLPVRSLPETIVHLARFDLCLVGSLHADAQAFREALTKARQASPGRYALASVHAARSIALIIGPEGDLTETETTALRDAGAHLVSFGNAVLRVETAALYGLSLLHYEFQA
ncbi:MAG: 16S rRNA (uracil(1498)-N(3))-methyltransferase [Kiritimatiellae bacterium]|nr:16S rRNA (uracil(1498)-N(3))-methyltransferase [Verrucomicrobiota bacterium]MBU4365908.1 16S rRNA (uracil(1498)-N(3))-methyltransferase [Verrucomicrobiota bacterium]MCG2660558.1 16S rRNA (uracil(1498)-N(3))-methyltransferase [Kiritimatiellia bacterium]